MYIKTISRKNKDGSVKNHYYWAESKRENGKMKTIIVGPASLEDKRTYLTEKDEKQTKLVTKDKSQDEHRFNKELENYRKIALSQDETIVKLKERLFTKEQEVGSLMAQINSDSIEFIEEKLEVLIKECLSGTIKASDGKTRAAYKVKAFAQEFLIPLLEEA